jgi:hypothetical protein
MAFTKEFLNGFFQGTENADDLIGKILSEHDADITGLKRKNDELLGSVKQHTEKYDVLQKEKTAFEATIKELNEKLESGLPDKERQHFQAEIEKYKTTAANTVAEMNRQIAERETTLKGLEAEHHTYICQAEFNELVNGDSSIIPELRESLRKLFFVDNQFEWVEVNGTRQLLNRDSKNMKDALTNFLGTTAGQHFKIAQNSGGGAAGGTRGTSGNSIDRKQFNTMTEAQRGEFIRKGGVIVSR